MKYIPINEIHKVWDEVREGLLKVKKHTSEKWLPEDVYLMLKTNQCTLHTDKDGGGFVILQKLSQFDGEAIHIWCAFSKSLKPLDNYIKEIEAMARSIGARRITLSSKRDWSKYFEPAGNLFKKELP